MVPRMARTRKPNHLQRRAQKHERQRQLIARAPRHPTNVEVRMRLLAAQLMASINAALKTKYLHKSARVDAPRPRTVARQQLRKTVTPLARDLAKSTHEQVASSLGVEAADLPIDLSEQAYGFVDTMVEILEGYPIEATKRVAEAFAEWESVAEEDRNVEALSTLLDGALDGAEGVLQQSLRLLFGDAFATMNQTAQRQSGVEGYYWQAMKDARTRPEHRDCDNTGSEKPYRWDAEPPLTASMSSKGEPCYPGDDYNCRCIAIPAELPSAADEAVSED